MKDLVNFEGEWGMIQIEALIELRYKDFKDMNPSNQDEWEIFIREWNQMQEYEVFTTKQVKEKLKGLYEEYQEIQIMLEGMGELEIELPSYWNKMVEFMPLSQNNLALLNNKKRKPESSKKKNPKKIKMPLIETIDGGLDNVDESENIIPLKSKITNENHKQSYREHDLHELSNQDGLGKIATAIENFGNIIKTEATGYHSKFEKILLNQQKLLELALEQIGKQLSERIDSGMNQIIDILKTGEADHEE